MSDVWLRDFQESDVVDLVALFYASIRHGTHRHYNEAEREAWVPEIPDVDQWRDRLHPLVIIVAQDNAGVAGFMTLDPSGHIDLAFVRPDLLGQGVARKIYHELETQAEGSGIVRLHCEASHLARSFFTKQGWSVIETQQVETNGLLLTNHRMQKMLT